MTHFNDAGNLCSKAKQAMGTFCQLELSFRIVPSTERERQKVHLSDGIDRDDALENSLCLTDSVGEKIITRMNLQISTRKIYCKTSNYKGLHLKNIIKNRDV